MPCGTWTTTDVPDAELGFVIALYRADNALKIETQKEPDGQWTVIATFPPCPAEASGSDHAFTALKASVSVANVQNQPAAATPEPAVADLASPTPPPAHDP